MSTLERATKIRWGDLWRRLECENSPMPFESVASAYNAPGRYYHTLAHIDHCLAELDALNVRPVNVDLIELALWFHDFVYIPQKNDNEMRSAEIAERAGVNAGIFFTGRRALAGMIFATKHLDYPYELDEDQKLVVDIDLSILGSQPGPFIDYERGVRAEYSFVSDKDFCKGRAAFLRKLLERSRIFHTDRFATMYERIAMENLAESIARLEAGRLP